MAIPASRADFKNYCLRNLGAPVLEINVDDDQLEDRIDESLDIFRLYHYDGIEKLYLKHQITASTMKITSNNGLSFAGNSRIVGQTSGVSATVYGSQNGVLPYNTNQNLLYVARLIPVVTGRPVGPTVMFTPGETITGVNASGATVTGTISTADDWFTPGDIENRYIPIADSVYGVTRVMPLFQGTSSSKSIFDLQYQLRLNDLYDLSSTSLIYYTTVMQHLATLDLLLNGKPIYRFNRLENRLQIDIDWLNGQKIDVGNYVIIEAYRGLDPVEFTKVWNEPWLKRYTTALFKRQWGTNLKKFSGLQLPGGVTLDGNLLYNEANAEIKALEDELQNKSAPLDFMMG
jgi:hypothetical protein